MNLRVDIADISIKPKTLLASRAEADSTRYVKNSDPVMYSP